MVTYLDRHAGAQLPDEKRSAIESEVKAHTPDKHGVVTRAIILDKVSDELTCITEGPNEEAIRKHHEDAGMPLGELHKVEAILE